MQAELIPARFDFDRVFPNAGGLANLRQVLNRDRQAHIGRSPRVEGTRYSKRDIERFRKIFDLLGDDDEAKATFADVVCFTDLKARVSGFFGGSD